VSSLDRIAFNMGIRDETPNQKLARELVEANDRKGLQEIADNLWNGNKSIRSDCLKVLYETGYLEPDLIADYVDSFLNLLSDKQNRMVWGAMIALSTVASLRPDAIWRQIDQVLAAIDKGTVITIVTGTKVLAQVAAANPTYCERLFPIMLERLRSCIPRDVPTHGESMLPAINDQNQPGFVAILESLCAYNA